jgi:hypothetical protein
MTSDFDDLMTIHGRSQKNPRLKPIAECLADLCIQEADLKKPGWNFETWKQGKWIEPVLAVYGEEELKWSYLNDCHDKLDHTQWHLRVFKPDTQYLIHSIYDIFRGRECWLKGLKRNAKRHLPKLLELLRAYGTEEDQYQIKLKDIPRDEF